MEPITDRCDFPLKSSKNIIFQNPFIFGLHKHVSLFSLEGFSLYYIFCAMFAFLEKNSFKKRCNYSGCQPTNEITVFNLVFQK